MPTESRVTINDLESNLNPHEIQQSLDDLRVTEWLRLNCDEESLFSSIKENRVAATFT